MAAGRSTTTRKAINDSDSNSSSTTGTTGPTVSARTIQLLLESVQLNRVTIVIGPTGCGKSTLIPAALLDGIGGPILCTQPRRLAVVAVATRVAQNRRTPLAGDSGGGDNNTAAAAEVGYHVGQSNHSTRKTKLLFATAGILLEDLRANGVEVLQRYECILIDECHERSPESDLCLAVIKQLMRSNPTETIRIVLMSATFDHERYKKYFHAVPGCDVINTLTLETAESFAAFYNRVETFYLDDIIPKLPNADSHAVLKQTMRNDPNVDLRGEGTDHGKSLTFHLLHLISSLVTWLDAHEPDATAPFLIFAPTYRHLEQIYEHLVSNCCVSNDHDNHENDNENNSSLLQLAVLHSSVDMEDCLRSMQQDSGSNTNHNNNNGNKSGKKRRRRVLLASAIADSSITIPGVTCVIDTCRSLQVAWDGERQRHSTMTVWTSRSICDQRQGRTGRTCAGRVFRLLPKRFYLSDNSVPTFETPQLTLSDCRNEVMSLLSSTFSEISDCVGLLAKSLDPPAPHVVKRAVTYLKNIGACIETAGRQRSKLVATEYGLLMATMPFSIADSHVILAAAQHGYLHEMLLFRTITTIRPSPVVNYFADQYKSEAALKTYRSDVDPKDPMNVAIAHMAAYMFWDAEWNSGRRQSAYKLFHRLSGGGGGLGPKLKGGFLDDSELHDEAIDRFPLRNDCGVWQWTVTAEESHMEWCRQHEINPTSVRAIADTIDVTLKILYKVKFEPEWLRCCPAEPAWQRRNAWNHQPSNETSTYMLWLVYGHQYNESLCRKLQEFSHPGVPVSSITTSPMNGQSIVQQLFGTPTKEVCIHFLNGKCTYGDRCRNAHSAHAKRPICKYFLSGTCSNGKKCMFLHEGGQNAATPTAVTKRNKGDPLKPLAPLLQTMSLSDGAKGWFVNNARNLLLLGENNFRFSAALASLGVPPRMSTERAKVDTMSRRFFNLDPSRVRTGVDATRIHADAGLLRAVGGDTRSFAWNFPYTGSDEDEAVHEDLILATFLSLGLFSKSANLSKPQFGLTLQGDQLSRWSVLRSARYAGWSLNAWSSFDHENFPGYRPCRANGDPFPYENGRLYVFELSDDAVN